METDAETDTESGNGRGKWKIHVLTRFSHSAAIVPHGSPRQVDRNTSMDCAGSRSDPILIGSSDSR